MKETSYLNTLPSALIAVDRSLTVQFINHAAENLLGISLHQIMGRALPSLPGFEGELCDLCRRVLGGREEISLFEHVLRLPLNHRSVTMHLTPVMDEGELDVSQLLITIEKTDTRDRLAANAWQREATRAAGVMAAMLAHEVKNPLAGIRGAAQLLKEEVEPEHQQLTELICMETDRIRDLLAQVEIFDSGAAGHKQPINIHEVLQYVISIAKTGFARHVLFKEHYDPSLPPVLGHRDMLVQLLLNLVKNSAEALAGQENATITFSTMYRSGYHIRANSPDAALSEARISLPIIVTVEDNGPGIPETIRPRLFEPFVSSKEDGRGLGLAVVAKLASDLGASVELDQEFEGGTRFILWLECGN